MVDLNAPCVGNEPTGMRFRITAGVGEEAIFGIVEQRIPPRVGVRRPTAVHGEPPHIPIPTHTLPLRGPLSMHTPKTNQPGFGRLESRAKAEARLDLEVCAGWASSPSR